MRVAIIGRSPMLYESAVKLFNAGHHIPLIITAKESPEYKTTSADFKRLAEKIGAEFIHTVKINDPEILCRIKQLSPIDVGVSVNYSAVIGNAAIECFDLGILNAHGGDLPRYRGNACQAWAILNGEARIGLCVHKMIGGELDSGDIIVREYMSIDIDTKIGHVFSWMQERVPSMFGRALNLLQNDRGFAIEKQSRDPKDALRCYPRIPDDGRIDWRKTNIEILRLINASSEPFPGAFCDFEGNKLIVWDAVVHEDEELYMAVPGQVCSIERDGSIIVVCGEGKLKIKEVEYEFGRRASPARIIKSIRKRLA